MATQLPTITVTDDQAARMLAAYGTVANYQTWLADSIIDFVLAAEMKKIDDAAYIVAQKAQADKDAAIAALVASLPPRSKPVPAY